MVSNTENFYPVSPSGGVCNVKHKRFMARIPRKHILKIGKLIGRLVYYLDVPHRRIVRRNLAFAYPDWSRQKIKKTSRRIFQNLGITFFDFFQLTALSREDILNRARVVGLENLQRGLESKKGLIIVSAHLGNGLAIWLLFFAETYPWCSQKNSFGAARSPDSSFAYPLRYQNY
jgi:lauroyl/myristoyl acyltransferase